MPKYWSLKRTEPSHKQKVSCSGHPGQIIWTKLEKSSKIGQDKESFLSTFA